jgi:hypothetical protein
MVCQPRRKDAADIGDYTVTGEHRRGINGIEIPLVISDGAQSGGLEPLPSCLLLDSGADPRRRNFRKPRASQGRLFEHYLLLGRLTFAQLTHVLVDATLVTSSISSYPLSQQAYAVNRKRGFRTFHSCSFGNWGSVNSRCSASTYRPGHQLAHAERKFRQRYPFTLN